MSWDILKSMRIQASVSASKSTKGSMFVVCVKNAMQCNRTCLLCDCCKVMQCLTWYASSCQTHFDVV